MNDQNHPPLGVAVDRDVGRVTLSGHELKAALEYLAPDGDAAQLDCSLVIEWWPANAGRNEEAGYYAWHAEYPDEGCILLAPNAEVSGAGRE